MQPHLINHVIEVAKRDAPAGASLSLFPISSLEAAVGPDGFDDIVRLVGQAVEQHGDVVGRIYNRQVWGTIYRDMLARMGRIEEARKRRIGLEFNEAWMRNNKKFIKKNDKRIDREVEMLSRRKGVYWDGEWHNDYWNY